MSKKIRYGSVCSGVEAASLAWKELGWECVFVSEIEPFPCAVLNRRFGASRPINDCSNSGWNKKNKELPEYNGTGIPNEGDFTKIGKKYENKYDLLVGGTPCFPIGTFVLTSDGYKPIEEISVGDMVLTDNLQLKKVVRTGKKIANNIVEVKIEGRLPFFVTANHPFQIAENINEDVKKIEIGNAEKKYATLLNTESFSKTNIYKNELKEFCEITNLSEEDASELIGWYLGCGIGDLYFHKIGDEVSALDILNVFDNKFHGKLVYKISFENNEKKYLVSLEKNVKNWLLNQFGNSEKIPIWVYGLNIELKNHIKKGFFDSRFRNSCDVPFSVLYIPMLYGLTDLFGNFECGNVITVKSENNENMSWDLFVANPYKYLENNGKCFARIQYVKKVESKEIVYNIEVEDDHTYIANGIRVWNCQDSSVAGKRAGLIEGSRSKLAFDFVKLAYESRVRWMVWENVPGVFSLNSGKDFAAFLSSFAGWDVTVPEGGWKSAGIVTNATKGNFGLAWRVFDGQYVRTQSFPFAVPQRRRRIFVIGYFGDWKRAAEVLFEQEGLYGDIEPCRKTRQEIAEDIRKCPKRTMRIYGTKGEGNNEKDCGREDGRCLGERFIVSNNSILNVSCFASAGFGQKVESNVASTLSTDHDDRVTGNNAALIMENPYTPDDISVIAIDGDKINKKERSGGSGIGINEEGVSYTLTAKDVHAVAYEKCGKNNSENIINNENQTDCFLTDGTSVGNISSTLQASLSKMVNNQNPVIVEKQECYNISFCDANGIRKDRPNGGCYITKTNTSKTITTEGQNETVIIDVFTKSSKPKNSEEAPTYKEAGVANTLNCFENNNEGRAVELICKNESKEFYAKGSGNAFISDVHSSLTTEDGQPGQGYPCVLTRSTVRRLMPIEAERLMGFPDNHTKIDWNGKSNEECPDSPRYKACGNSMCVNVMQWIGEQIQRVEDKINIEKNE